MIGVDALIVSGFVFNIMEKSIPLKEIVGFLPYELKCYAQGMSTADTEFDEYPKPQEFEIVGLDVKYVSIYEEGRTVTEEMEYCDIIPHVRPLSDLTKEITYNGETFVPIMRLFGGYDYAKYKYELKVVEKRFIGQIIYISVEGIGDNIISFSLKNPLFNSLNNENWQKLYEWHFDIYDWIKDGKAISINDL